MACDTTVLTGSGGAFWYKPANTEICLPSTSFPATGSNITVGNFLGFRVNDPVTLTYPAGAVVTGAIAAGNYFVKTYDASTGIMTISSTLGGTAATATAQPTGFGSNLATIAYQSFIAVAQVRDWTFEITRAEIDVTTIGVQQSQYAPFRKYQTSFADGSGTASVYFTDDDAAMSNRMIQDVIQRRQSGAAAKLYIDAIYSGATISDSLSRYIQTDIVLTSASLGANPDDAQLVSINFRPAGSTTFDLSKSS